MKSKITWLSYDLGINGDFENIYTWLDRHDARECGDNFAVFHFSFKRDLESEIKASLKKEVKIRAKDRIYIVFQDDEGNLKGRFIFGRRKAGPWRGYAEISAPDFWDQQVS